MAIFVRWGMAGGFKPAHFDFFRGELLTSFGVRVLPALHALERLGWLVSNSHPLYRPLPVTDDAFSLNSDCVFYHLFVTGIQFQSV